MSQKFGFLAGENASMGSKQRETRWLTPAYLVEPLGKFDLDPCGAPGHRLAERTYQIDDGEDGLELPWEGRVWLNPPYGKQAEPFLKKMVKHGHGTALIFARTETNLSIRTFGRQRPPACSFEVGSHFFTRTAQKHLLVQEHLRC